MAGMASRLRGTAPASIRSTEEMRRLRIILWAAVVAAASFLAVLLAGVLPPRDFNWGRLPLAASFGGPFELTAADGTRFSSKRLEGKPYAIFFGFTQCPDICPTTLLDMSNHMRDLGPAADRMNFVFVSVDPERDTPEVLKSYLANFDPRIIGLTGTPAEISGVARAYRIIYEKVPTSSGYTMNHSAAVFLIDSGGGFAGTISFQEPQATQLEKLRRHATR
jgi:protein SCO1/2